MGPQSLTSILQHKLATRDYLEHHKLSVYLEDVLIKLLEDRPEKPMNYLYDYFESVRLGTNILLRDFEYVKATTRNRISFAHLLESILNSKADRHTALELHQLAELICTDFPGEIVERAAEIASYSLGLCIPDLWHHPSMQPDKQTVQLPIPEFIKVFRTYFSFLEFFEMCEEILRDTLSTFHQNNLMAGRQHVNSDDVFTVEDISILEDIYVDYLKRRLCRLEGFSVLVLPHELAVDIVHRAFQTERAARVPSYSSASIIYFQLTREIVDSHTVQALMERAVPIAALTHR
ncbi:uncharacterized protein BJ171DRAFT_625906 [Polychytrium aggregatum]|uniref:uncharacterized protein n=1 Tax=Polychytrium aggregatum TaxID=110093 RepID=UPI0022FE806C|nr:uncharacterized protein BJ171DRAFT_625906 [Polychytrium aggregatum]KAI9202850.1 hypothetical protein BJ171DRAFT_625906 [Polychytrium aggregatum]